MVEVSGHGTGEGSDCNAMQSCIDEFAARNVGYRDVLYRALRDHLATSYGISHEQIEARAGISNTHGERKLHPNVLEEVPWTPEIRGQLNRATCALASEHCSREAVAEVLEKALSKAKEDSLVKYVHQAHITSAGLLQHLQSFCVADDPERSLSTQDCLNTRARLARLLLSDEDTFIAAAKKFIPITAYLDLAERMVTTDEVIGRVGGKSANAFLAYHILTAQLHQQGVKLQFPIRQPETYPISADVFEAVVRLNHLEGYSSLKYAEIAEVEASYERAREDFLSAEFPEQIREQLRDRLERMGEGPIIVRSSGLLEDSSKADFSGIYDSIFLPNTGPIEDRLRQLETAILTVYSGVSSPQAIAYRKNHEKLLLDVDESMGIELQKVVGERVGEKHFCPAFAGVAYSYNDYPWNEQIAPEDGLVNVVPGLGTAAVDRQAGDSPIIFSPTEPKNLPQGSTKEVLDSAPRRISLLNLEAGSIESLDVYDLIGKERFPLEHLVFHGYSFQDDRFVGWPSSRGGVSPVATFKQLLTSTEFPAQMDAMLRCLKENLEHDVDMEFAVSGGPHPAFYLLQNRPMHLYKEVGSVELPASLEPEDLLFQADRMVPTVKRSGLTHLVYVDSEAYRGLVSSPEHHRVAEAIQAVNGSLPKGDFLLMGPGRWGTEQTEQGVPVKFYHIDRTAMLIEMGDSEVLAFANPSFGSHFFNLLRGADIRPVTVFPKDPKAAFNEDFFAQSRNRLADIAPQFADLSDVIKVIDVKSDHQATIEVRMSRQAGKGIVYLQREREAE
ncbi:MAG: hypothetical protein KDD70_09120 [Bdellovibrionales bacterium]|nr:hypothetical protein [Bdellovibrionales bacterium]